MNKTQSIHFYKQKLVIFFFLLGFLAVVVMLFRWQIFDSERFIAIANERYRVTKIPSVRGSILAKDGSTLAFSEPRFDVFVWLPEIKDAEKNLGQTHEEFLQKVSTALKITPEELQLTLDSGPSWIKIAGKVDVETRNQLLNLRQDNNPDIYIKGMQMEYVNKRVYPENDLASHVLGFVGLNTSGESVGVSGLEQYWEGSLKPIEGIQTGEFDSFGNAITLDEESSLEPQPGVTIYTTIDKVLQEKLEVRLKDGLEKFGAKSATGIIMDPQTGYILAMANYPDFDPNEYFKETDGSVFGNNAITVPYEIGSVAKVFTLSAAIDSGSIKADTVILPNGHNGCEIIEPKPKPGSSCFSNTLKAECICTYDRKVNHNLQTAADALLNSDNIAFRHIALTMEYQQFHDYLVKFGAGSLTGIDLTGESTGLLKDAEKWNYADQAVFSYGHGYNVTPIQAITGIGVIANEGERMQPYLVYKVIDSKGNTTEFNPRVVEQVISPETSRIVQGVMHEVYLNTLTESRYRSLDKYYIALKSGTALIPYQDRAGYSDRINATYVGYDASPDKKFIMLVKLEDPSSGDLSFFNTHRAGSDFRL